MKTIITSLKEVMERGFEKAGYESRLGMVTVSNRPDLCQYQCNGAMAAAKQYKKAPILIANEIVEAVKENSIFSSVEAIAPGFININLSDVFLADYMNEMMLDEKMGCETAENPKTIVIDYGGPNVAKPLHVGHLRSAIIGESIKRIARFSGHRVIGDVHFGDWGLQIGLVITELRMRQPELAYFDPAFEGEYPEDAPFTLSDLEEIYPYASKKSKEDEEYKVMAQTAVAELQNGRRGYKALWQMIMKLSIADVKRIYGMLQVDFDVWKGESDADAFIPDMIEKLKQDGLAYLSEGALVVDVKEESDKKEIPPCIIMKSNGASNYETTDLATIIERNQLFSPDCIIYVADKRQELHFDQVFRCARKAGFIPAETSLEFVGFGTMNGKDGKPFKTRDGGVLRLESLIAETDENVYKKMENRELGEELTREISAKVGLAAIKYGDLSNQAGKNYIFDMERFTSFEGNTGPYILYTIVRIKSILTRYQEQGGDLAQCNKLAAVASDAERNVVITLSKLSEVIKQAYNENAPHKICQYIYELSDTFNRFYHDTKILAQEDETRKRSYLTLLIFVKKVLELCIELLGFDAPDKM